MLKEGGVTGLWRGKRHKRVEDCSRIGTEATRRKLSAFTKRFCAGALAGGISQTAIYPLEVLKTPLALRKTGQYKSIADAAYKIYVGEGLMSFYRGYIPNILGIIPYAGIDLAVYETLKRKYLKTHMSNEQPSFWMPWHAAVPAALWGRCVLIHWLIHPAMDPSTVTMSGEFRTHHRKGGYLRLVQGNHAQFHQSDAGSQYLLRGL
ncbi:hypothetical protein NQ318_023271 [Aromia moschata]|uniref:Uncharacterized protein n=1 Tax=Aromia moschata TaxID=1265417 RepID=A0AAV8Y6F9_9CUCU|nr:hypothetical protein NQ318_023271 [Aromia moschata]